MLDKAEEKAEFDRALEHSVQKATAQKAVADKALLDMGEMQVRHSCQLASHACMAYRYALARLAKALFHHVFSRPLIQSRHHARSPKATNPRSLTLYALSHTRLRANRPSVER